MEYRCMSTTTRFPCSTAHGRREAAAASWKPLVLADGGFAEARTYSVGSPPRELRAGDLEADGDVDLVNVTVDGVSALLNHGDGRFASAAVSPVGFWRDAVAVADLNGDAGVEIALGRGSSVALFESAFATVNSSDCNADGVPDECQLGTAGDCNGNGDVRGAARSRSHSNVCQRDGGQ